MGDKLPRLDRGQAFGTVHGGGVGAAVFTQHGLYFDRDGACVTTKPESLAAANALIAAELNPVLDTDPVRYVDSGRGSYEIHNAAGEAFGATVTFQEAVALVPLQFREELATKSRSDLVTHFTLLGGVVSREDTVTDIIDNIVAFTTKVAPPVVMPEVTEVVAKLKPKTNRGRRTRRGVVAR